MAETIALAFVSVLGILVVVAALAIVLSRPRSSGCSGMVQARPEARETYRSGSQTQYALVQYKANCPARISKFCVDNLCVEHCKEFHQLACVSEMLEKPQFFARLQEGKK